MDSIAPFDKSKPVKWFVVDRKQGRGVVASFESPAAFCFHTTNAYEVASSNGNDAVDLICDLIEYDNLDLLHMFYFENLKETSPTKRQEMAAHSDTWHQRLVRYRLASVPTTSKDKPLTNRQREQQSPLPTARQAELLKTIPAPIVGDIPTINPKYATKPYKYVYNCSVDLTRASLFESISKIDVENESGLRWDNPPGHFPGEPIFIPDPAGVDEDDGVVLSVVLDGHNSTSYLLCLDAKTMKEVGRADCEGPVAFTFHGQHIGVGKVEDAS